MTSLIERTDGTDEKNVNCFCEGKEREGSMTGQERKALTHSTHHKVVTCRQALTDGMTDSLIHTPAPAQPPPPSFYFHGHRSVHQDIEGTRQTDGRTDG
mmetsp:Transcript_26212/g.51472  ORF Transcript_26212/g.51472 Transcript_26212/m.51472 type:complete len:99 (-) Transcript_26212:479-775(-)